VPQTAMRRHFDGVSNFVKLAAKISRALKTFAETIIVLFADANAFKKNKIYFYERKRVTI
jgi:hypothetical protein